MGENGSRLVRQIQPAIVCPQRVKIGKDIELGSNPKVAIFGQIIIETNKFCLLRANDERDSPRVTPSGDSVRVPGGI